MHLSATYVGYVFTDISITYRQSLTWINMKWIVKKSFVSHVLLFLFLTARIKVGRETFYCRGVEIQ